MIFAYHLTTRSLLMSPKNTNQTSLKEYVWKNKTQQELIFPVKKRSKHHNQKYRDVNAKVVNV